MQIYLFFFEKCRFARRVGSRTSEADMVIYIGNV